MPVVPDLLGVGAPRGLALRNVNLVSGFGVTLRPSRVGVGAQPLWCRRRQGVQRRAQCLDGAAQAVEGAHGPEHVRAVGALSTAGDQQLVLLT